VKISPAARGCCTIPPDLSGNLVLRFGLECWSGEGRRSSDMRSHHEAAEVSEVSLWMGSNLVKAIRVLNSPKSQSRDTRLHARLATPRGDRRQTKAMTDDEPSFDASLGWGSGFSTAGRQCGSEPLLGNLWLPRASGKWRLEEKQLAIAAVLRNFPLGSSVASALEPAYVCCSVGPSLPTPSTVKASTRI